MWYNKYVGIPYQDNGRTEAGLDCWGLVRLVYKREYGIELPSFDTQYLGSRDVDATSELLAQNRENWQPDLSRTIGSVVLFRVLGRESHVGIYIGNNKFLHARENHSSVIESLNSSMWKDRVVGFFKYSENSGILVNAVPNPLKTQRYTEVLSEGVTLKSVLEQITEKYKISARLKSKVVVLLNGKLATPEDFERKLTKFDTVEYRLVPEGSNPLRSILMIVVMFAAIMTQQWYVLGQMQGLSAAAATAGLAAPTVIPGSIAFAGALVAQGVMMVGMMLVDAIAPVRLPKQDSPSDPGSAAGLNMFSGGSNQRNPYGPVPVVLGKMRMTPPLASSSFIKAEEYTSYMSMNLCWGAGDIYLDEGTLMVGGVTVAEYIANGNPPEVVTLDNRGTTTDASQIALFKTIFSTDIKQVYPNQELTADAQVGIPGPWKEVILEDESLETANKINKFTVTLSFPEGLRKIWTGGGDAGTTEPATASFLLEYAKRIPGTQTYEPFNSAGVDSNILSLPSNTNTVVSKPPKFADINGNVFEVGRWCILGLRNNILVSKYGKPADIFTYGNLTQASQSSALAQSIAGGYYGDGVTATATATYPTFATESGTIPLLSVWIDTTGYTFKIDHTTAPGISKTGLAFTYEDYYDPTPIDYGNGTGY